MTIQFYDCDILKIISKYEICIKQLGSRKYAVLYFCTLSKWRSVAKYGAEIGAIIVPFITCHNEIEVVKKHILHFIIPMSNNSHSQCFSS